MTARKEGGCRWRRGQTAAPTRRSTPSSVSNCTTQACSKCRGGSIPSASRTYINGLKTHFPFIDFREEPPIANQRSSAHTHTRHQLHSRRKRPPALPASVARDLAPNEALAARRPVPCIHDAGVDAVRAREVVCCTRMGVCVCVRVVRCGAVCMVVWTLSMSLAVTVAVPVPVPVPVPGPVPVAVAVAVWQWARERPIPTVQ